jgi:hypothetical protein
MARLLLPLTNLDGQHAHGFDGERAMKMTSKGTLLLMAGVIGLGCSSPADDDDGTMKPAPVGQPPYLTQPAPAPAANNTPVNNPQPTQNTETNMPTNVAQNPAPGAGGAGAGAGGAGAMPAAGAIPRGAPGTGFNLTPVQGWVAGGTNEAGIQGAFSTISDATAATPGATTIMPTNFMAATDAKICVSGSASQVVNNPTTAMPDYARYWGGGVAFDLGDPGQMMPKVPWVRGRVVGFSFDITGTTIPPLAQFRFGVAPYEGSTIKDDGPSVGKIKMGTNTIMFSALHSQCYNATPGAALPDTAMLASLKWQVATVVTAATPFNFCIENLKAIVQ